MRIKKKSIIKFCILLAIVIGVIVYFENYRLEKLEVESGNYYTPEEIENYLVKSSMDRFTHVFYLKYAVFSSPEPLPYVEKMEFEIVDANTVHVTVYDKVLIGCVEHMGQYICFDREGIVVESSDAPDMGVPVITGIEFSKVVIGEKLEIQDQGMFKRILDMVLELEKQGIACERIHFDIRGNVKLYIGGSEALLGNGDVHDYQISALKNVLDASNGKDYCYDLEKYDRDKGEIPAKPIEKDE